MMVSPQISGDIASAVVDSHAVLSPAPLCGMPTETVGVQQLFPFFPGFEWSNRSNIGSYCRID